MDNDRYSGSEWAAIGRENYDESNFSKIIITDWRDSESFDYLWINRGEGIAVHVNMIAWEFLRRNVEYISLEEVYKLLFVKMKLNVAMEGDAGALNALERDICDKFGIVRAFGIRNPNAGMPPIFKNEFLPNCDLISYWCNGEKVGFGNDDVPDGICMDVRIVAERPLHEQMDEIQAMYEKMTSAFAGKINTIDYSKRDRSDVLINYIRIYDGWKEVGDIRCVSDIIYSGDEGRYEKAKKQLRRAIELIDGGYKDIVRPFPGSKKLIESRKRRKSFSPGGREAEGN